MKIPLGKGTILTDEVGLGKTIESGLVTSQLWEEKTKNSFLVRRSLRKQ